MSAHNICFRGEEKINNFRLIKSALPRIMAFAQSDLGLRCPFMQETVD